MKLIMMIIVLMKVIIMIMLTVTLAWIINIHEDNINDNYNTTINLATAATITNLRKKNKC